MKPMLSATLEDVAAVKFPVLCSPKLDGIRCALLDGRAYSRNMKPIPNKFVQKQLAALAWTGLDGELIVGDPKADDCYRRTNSGVMSAEGEPDFTFWAFDLWAEAPFEVRLVNAGVVLRNFPEVKRARMVPHRIMRTEEELNAYEATHILAGYEGVMGRSPDGPYKEGRATMREGYLWKLKRFADGDYEVIGIIEQEHNGNAATRDELGRTKRTSHKAGKTGKGAMGALEGRDTVTGVEFNVGTGFDDAARQDIWDNWPRDKGTVRKYKSLSVGVKDKPRHPVDLGPRADI